MTRKPLTTVVAALAVLLLLGGLAAPADEDQPLQTIPESAEEPAPPSAAADTPLIEIAEPQHHAGTVARGEECSAVYTVRNSGTADLRLIKADGHCSCISAAFSPPVIPPGEEGEVEVTFVGQTAVGETTRVIELTSNDPQNRVSRLTFSARVEVPFDFETPALALGKIHHRTAERFTGQAALLILDPADADLAGLESSSPQITARATGPGDPRDGHQRLEIEISTGAGLPPGPLKETITAIAASGKHPPAVLNITALVTGDVEVTPDQLHLVVVETGKRDAKANWKRIYLTGHCPDRPLSVFHSEDSNELLELDLVELIPGEKYELTVTLGAEALEVNSEVEGTISISTNSPSQAVITVGYTAARRLYDKLDQQPAGDEAESE